MGAVLRCVGLTAEFRGRERFEVVCADAADASLKGEGVSAARREVVWDAIALHAQIGIASRKRPEIALVHIGAGVDSLELELELERWAAAAGPGRQDAGGAATPRL
jgi:hypothetical protein